MSLQTMLFTTLCAFSVAAFAEPLTIDLATGENTTAASKGVNSLTLNLRFIDADTGAAVSPRELAVVRNIEYLTTATTITDIKQPIPVPKPYRFFSVLSVPRNGAGPEFFSMGALRVPLPEDGTSVSQLTLKLSSTLLNSHSNLFWLKTTADGYYPSLQNAAILARTNPSGTRDFVYDRVIKLAKPSRKIADAPTTQTVELATGVTAQIPPGCGELWLDVLPKDSASDCLENMNTPYYNLPIALYPANAKLPAPVILTIKASQAFPALKRASCVRFAKLDMRTWRYAFETPLEPEIESLGKPMVNRTWNYTCSLDTPGFYFLSR